jgi:coenzyme F420-reducing hydrogenase delta subunit
MDTQIQLLKLECEILELRWYRATSEDESSKIFNELIQKLQKLNSLRLKQLALLNGQISEN